MMNCEQFLKKMRGEQIVLRLYVLQRTQSVSSADGEAFAFYHECEGMHYGARFQYRCDEHGVFQPLRVEAFPHDEREWPRYLEGILEKWDNGPWIQNKAQIMGHYSREHAYRDLDAGHPVILRHLAVFQGLLLATPAQPMTNVLQDIAARRLDGLIRGRVSAWSKLV